MSRVITFSRQFPAYHSKAGQPTFFVEQILNSLFGKGDRGVDPDAIDDDLRSILNDFALLDGAKKHHTIRAATRWNLGDKFSPRVWSGKPYASKQITIAPDIEIRKVMSFDIQNNSLFVDGEELTAAQWLELAQNDGLHVADMLNWFKYPKPFTGQIICWNPDIEY